MATLRKMRKARSAPNATRTKFRGGMCDCELDDLPQRSGLKSLGKLSALPNTYGTAR